MPFLFIARISTLSLRELQADPIDNLLAGCFCLDVCVCMCLCVCAQKNNWKVGEKSDETVHMLLCAGPVTASSPFTLEKDSPGWARAFAGSISYTI